MTGADFKSATADDNRKLFIETYGCQMNVADSEVICLLYTSYYVGRAHFLHADRRICRYALCPGEVWRG